MSQPAWSEDWFDTATPLGVASWRGVDAQYIVATMRLVDNLREQAILEQVLQNAQSGLAGPPRSRSARLYAPQHELMTAPFRHRSPHASRFRPAGAAGVWYGAQTLHAAAAEVYPSGQVTLNPGRRPRMLGSTSKCVDTWTLPRSGPMT